MVNLSTFYKLIPNPCDGDVTHSDAAGVFAVGRPFTLMMNGAESVNGCSRGGPNVTLLLDTGLPEPAGKFLGQCCVEVGHGVELPHHEAAPTSGRGMDAVQGFNVGVRMLADAVAGGDQVPYPVDLGRGEVSDAGR